MAHLYDIGVLGASPAGWAAAYYLARKKCDVVLVGTPSQAAECPLADWVAADFFRLPNLPRSLAGRCRAEPFRSVHYHNANLSRHVNHSSRSYAGYFVQTDSLNRALRDAARKAGAAASTSSKRLRVQLEEDFVRLVDGRETRAKLLLIVHNRPNDVIRDLSLPVRTVPESHLLAAGLDVPLTSRTWKGRLRGALHVVESSEGTELGMFFLVASVLHLRIVSSSRASGTRAAELSQMVARLQDEQILPAELSLGKARGAVWRPPAGVALELESHVTKRCLLAGTAGGFADTITGHTLLPSVLSALLAADAALKALKSRGVQETLMGFKTSWRESLADYLRPPNTSLQMLLPLLFVNQKIVGRFTRALLNGENI